MGSDLIYAQGVDIMHEHTKHLGMWTLASLQQCT